MYRLKVTSTEKKFIQEWVKQHFIPTSHYMVRQAQALLYHAVRISKFQVHILMLNSNEPGKHRIAEIHTHSWLGGKLMQKSNS